METLYQVLSSLSQWLSPYYTEISLTITATLLVVYGDVVNKNLKLMLKPYPFIVRASAFVLVCAFGYGMVIVFVSPFVQQAIMTIPIQFRGISVVSIFLLLGYLAEHRRYI